MIECILTRIESIHSNLRTDEVFGETKDLPMIGKSFVMSADPINENAFIRVIETSPVKEVRHHTEEGSLEFWTNNSHYGLQILDMGTSKGVN